MNTLYIEAESGISADMIAGMLIDLGANKDLFMKAIRGSLCKHLDIDIRRVDKEGIDTCDFVLKDSSVSKEHIHRSLKEVREIVATFDLEKEVKELVFKMYDILAESEVKAHNKPLGEIYFHEIGSLRAIGNIVAVAVFFKDLNIDQVIIKRVAEGMGCVHTSHGILPVPVPAVLNIVSEYNLPIFIVEDEGEHITPSGAAFLAAVVTRKELPESFIVEKVGLGAGKRNYKTPGFLRGMLIK